MPPKSSKPTFKTTIPFTETRWPVISPAVRDNILHLLCHLLQPIGDHRKTHIHPSKGKSKKRKRRQQQQEEQQSYSIAEPTNTQHGDTTTKTNSPTPPPPPPPSPPPPPEIKTHVLIGLNSVTRHLEALVAQNKYHQQHPPPENPPNEPTTKDQHKNKEPTPSPNPEETQNPTPLTLLFILHPNPTHSLAHAHIPPLVHLSTLSLPPPPPPPSHPSSAPNPQEKPTKKTYLIPLPGPAAESLLASTLHIPRVGAVGILDGAPGADALLRYVRENVGEDGVVRCEWVREAVEGAWRGVRIVR